MGLAGDLQFCSNKVLSRRMAGILIFYFNLKSKNDEEGNPEVSYKNDQRIEVRKS